MGIVSQLMDRGKEPDYDAGTLAELLRGLAEGRAVDTTPFGMWGVRNMDPNKLATAMSAAEEINQKRQQAELAADASRFGSLAHLTGVQDQGDVGMYGHDVQAYRGLMDALTHAGNQQNLMNIEKLRSATELQKGEARNISEQKKAEIMANPKNMMQLGPQGTALLISQLMNPKLAPEDAQRIGEMLAVLRSPDPGAAMAEYARRRAAEKAAKPGPGPGLVTRAMTPGPEVPRPADLPAGQIHFNIDPNANLYNLLKQGQDYGVGWDAMMP